MAILEGRLEDGHLDEGPAGRLFEAADKPNITEAWQALAVEIDAQGGRADVIQEAYRQRSLARGDAARHSRRWLLEQTIGPNGEIQWNHVEKTDDIG